jgi:hypothetical protein
MGRGVVGMGEPGKCRYRLFLWRYLEWHLPEAEWWSDDVDVLRQQAAESKDFVGRQGMYYRLWDMEEGKQLDARQG